MRFWTGNVGEHFWRRDCVACVRGVLSSQFGVTRADVAGVFKFRLASQRFQWQSSRIHSGKVASPESMPATHYC